MCTCCNFQCCQGCVFAGPKDGFAGKEAKGGYNLAKTVITGKNGAIINRQHFYIFQIKAHKICQMQYYVVHQFFRII